MRTKICKDVLPEETYPPNDIYRRFRKVIADVLSEDTLSVTRNGLSNAYVKNEYVEAQLQQFLESTHSDVWFMIGETGSGKSTYINNYFQIENKVSISQDRLIIPISLDSIIVDEKTPKNNAAARIKNQVNGAIRLLKQVTNIEYSDTALYDFIDEHKPGLIDIDDPFAEIDKKRLSQSCASTPILNMRGWR